MNPLIRTLYEAGEGDLRAGDHCPALDRWAAAGGRRCLHVRPGDELFGVVAEPGLTCGPCYLKLLLRSTMTGTCDWCGTRSAKFTPVATAVATDLGPLTLVGHPCRACVADWAVGTDTVIGRN